MANWRPVDVRLWNDRKFLAGGDDARLLWLYLLTCPALPIPGVVLGGDAALAEMLGWTPERLRERFHEIMRNGLRVRRESRIVWLPNALKYQPPANPNMVKCWAGKWDDVPEGYLKVELWEALKIACKPWSVLFAKLFAEPLPDGSGNGSPNGSWNGSTHKHDHKHQHDHDHNTEKNLSLPGARAIPPSPEPVAQPAPAASPPPPPREDIAMPDASSAPGVAHRTAIRTTLRAELEAARARAAASHRTTVTPLLAFEHGIDVDLQDHLTRATTTAALSDLEVQGRKAIAMAELEVTLGLQSFQWFNGAVFSGRNFSRLASRNPEDVRREAAEKRAKAERAALGLRAYGSQPAIAPPRKPDLPPKPVSPEQREAEQARAETELRSRLTPEQRADADRLAASLIARRNQVDARAGPVPAPPTDDPDDEPITESSA